MKIDIPSVLLHLRGEAVRAKASLSERAAFGAVAWLFRSPRRFALAQRLGRVAQRPSAAARPHPPAAGALGRLDARARPASGRARDLQGVVEP